MTMLKATLLSPINLKFGDVVVTNLSFQNADGSIEKRPAFAVVLFYDKRDDKVPCSLIFNRTNYNLVNYDYIISVKGTGISYDAKPVLSASSLIFANVNDTKKIGELSLNDKEIFKKLLGAMNMSFMSELVTAQDKGIMMKLMSLIALFLNL